jgi:hypothetical protein
MMTSAELIREKHSCWEDSNVRVGYNKKDDVIRAMYLLWLSGKIVDKCGTNWATKRCAEIRVVCASGFGISSNVRSEGQHILERC